MRVLPAEDEKKVAGYIRSALRVDGFVVGAVYGGDEALALTEAKPC